MSKHSNDEDKEGEEDPSQLPDWVGLWKNWRRLRMLSTKRERSNKWKRSHSVERTRTGEAPQRWAGAERNLRLQQEGD